MKIHLVSHTPNPKKAIAAAILNLGIGKDVKSIEDITDKEAEDALADVFKSHLDSPLEFASFNFFWEDLPIFLRAQLVRHRVGWSFAERSLRFYDANLRNPADDYDWDAMPSIPANKTGAKEIFKDRNIRELVQDEMKRQMSLYSLLIEEGVDQQDARNIIGVWYPTAMQTGCTYRALRQMLADRLSTQAHPLWQKAAHEIKELVTKIDKQLGDGLVDSCELAGRCVWRSKFDRECKGCVTRGWVKPHEHKFDQETTFGKDTQCWCGVMKTNLLK